MSEQSEKLAANIRKELGTHNDNAEAVTVLVASVRQQLDAKEEECRQRIKADRLYCMRHGGEAAQELAAENAELNQQLDQSQADVARLREALTWSLGKLSFVAPLAGGNHGYIRAFEKAYTALSETSSDAFIKLKQAEALKDVSLKIAIMCETDPQEVVLDEAQRLRGEANNEC